MKWWKMPFSVNQGARDPQLHLVMFGKHPAWKDHKEDLGDWTDTLQSVRHNLYGYGIASNIYSGSWEQLAPGHAFGRFDHTLMWWLGDTLILGLMWPSRDQVGRSKFPMIACAQCDNVPPDWAVEHVLPVLKRMRTDCLAAETQEQVHKVMDAAIAQGVRLIEDHPPKIVDEPEPEPLGRLAALLNIGQDNTELHRFMHFVDQKLEGYKETSKTRQGDSQAVHCRVPFMQNRALASYPMWLDTMLDLLSDDTQIVLAHPHGQPWMDMIIGSPTEKEWFYLQTSLNAEPPVTQIPYTIKAKYCQTIDEALARTNPAPSLAIDSAQSSIQPVSIDTTPTDAPSQRVATEVPSPTPSTHDAPPVAAVPSPPQSPPAIESPVPAPPVTTQPKSQSWHGWLNRFTNNLKSTLGLGNKTRGFDKKKTLILCAIGAVVLLLLVIIISSLGNGHPDDNTDRSGEDPNAPPALSPVEQERWRQLCLNYYYWFDALTSYLDKNPQAREEWPKQAYLNDLILQPMAQAQNSQRSLDPWGIAGSEYEGALLRDLAEKQPIGIRNEETQGQIKASLDFVNRVRNGLTADAFKTSSGRLVKSLVKTYQSRGWKAADQINKALKTLYQPGDKQLNPDIQQVTNSVTALLPLCSQLDAIEDAVVQIEQNVQAIEKAPEGPAALTSFGARIVQPTKQQWTELSIDKLEERAQLLAMFTGEQARFVSEEWKNKVNRTLANQQVKYDVESANPRQSYEAWRKEINDYYALSEDQRKDPELWALFESVRKTISDIKKMQAIDDAKSLEDSIKVLVNQKKNLDSLDLISKHAKAIKGGVEDLKALLRALSENALLTKQRVSKDMVDRLKTFLTLQTLPGVDQEAINEAWRQRRDAFLANIDKNAIQTDPAKAQEAQARLSEAETLQGKLKELSKDVAMHLPSPQQAEDKAPAWQQAMAKQMIVEHQQAVRRVVKALMPEQGIPDPGNEQWRKAYAQAQKDWGEYLVSVNNIKTLVQSATRHLDQCYGLDEAWNEPGKSINKVSKQWQQERAYSDMTGALAQPIKRLSDQSAVETASDEKTLFGHFDGDDASLATAAWRRLADMQKNGRFDITQLKLTSLANARTKLHKLWGSVEAGRRERLTKIVQGQLLDWWTGYARTQKDSKTIEQALILAGQIKLPTGSLEPRDQFNMLLYDLKTSSLKWEKDDVSKQATQEFINKAKSLKPTGDDDAARAREAIDLLTKQLQSNDGSNAGLSSRDLAKVGPASSELPKEVRWKLLQRGEQDQWLTYTWTPEDKPDQTHVIRFRRFRTGGNKPYDFYLSTTECTLGLFIDVSNRSVRWGQIRSLLEQPRGKLTPNVHEGLRGWKWTNNKMLVKSIQWTHVEISGLGFPELKHPAHRVSVKAAMQWALVTGCRLPTVQEWQTAYRETTDKTTTPNLRDQTCKNKLLANNQFDDEVVNKAFAAHLKVNGVNDNKTLETDDHTPWLARVTVDPNDNSMKDLVGNVAEYVTNTPIAAADVRAMALDAFEKWVTQNKDQFHVIGGSAISHPDANVNKPYPIGSLDASGFSDVGFRLAFTAPKESHTEILKKCINELNYIGTTINNK